MGVAKITHGFREEGKNKIGFLDPFPGSTESMRHFGLFLEPSQDQSRLLRAFSYIHRITYTSMIESFPESSQCLGLGLIKSTSKS